MHLQFIICAARDHALHLLADIVVRTPQQLHKMGHSAGVHHSLQDVV